MQTFSHTIHDTYLNVFYFIIEFLVKDFLFIYENIGVILPLYTLFYVNRETQTLKV